MSKQYPGDSYRDPNQQARRYTESVLRAIDDETRAILRETEYLKAQGARRVRIMRFVVAVCIIVGVAVAVALLLAR